MKKIIGLAAILCCLSSQALAYTFTRVGQSGPPPPFDPPPATQSIALAATGSFPGDSISIGIDPPLAVGDRVVLTLTGGATFDNAAYRLEQWQGGAGTGDLTYATLTTAAPSGATSIEFVMSESTGFAPQALADVIIFVLSGNTTAGQATNYALPQIPGVDISLQLQVFDAGNASKGTAQMLLFQSSLAPLAPVPTLGFYGMLMLAAGLAWVARRQMRS